MTSKYNQLLDVWKTEKNSSLLQPLEENFFSEMNRYVVQLRNQENKHEKESMWNRIIKREKENSTKMLSDLAQLRLRKIIISEIEGKTIIPSVLAKEEKALHSDFRRVLVEHNNRIKSNISEIAPKKEADPISRKEFKVVRFIKALPAIMGIDMKTYGPFEVEDIVSIPVENAENLIRKGFAKEVEIQS
jgi:DNA replication factor GINS